MRFVLAVIFLLSWALSAMERHEHELKRLSVKKDLLQQLFYDSKDYYLDEGDLEILKKRYQLTVLHTFKSMPNEPCSCCICVFHQTFYKHDLQTSECFSKDQP